MKKITVFLFLLTSFYLFSMSDSTEADPKVNPHKITQEELHNIAVNYYHYEFEEKHEWKGIRVDSSKSVIKDIFPYEEDEITFFYTINYNPDGHTCIPAYDYVLSPGVKGGGGWAREIKSIDSKEVPVPAKRLYHVMKRNILKGLKDDFVIKEKEKLRWEMFNKPPNQFHERMNFDTQYPQPKWWIEKKNLKSSKNTEGMIQTEWHQYFPFNNNCPTISSEHTVVGCTPLAMSQLMKYHEWPIVGIGENSYGWYADGKAPPQLLEANFGATTYDWANMTSYADSSSSQTEQDAISTLCKHFGIALNADYGIDPGTAAFVEFIPSRITEHFNYTSQLDVESGLYTDSLSAWKDSLIISMQKGIPVIYNGDWEESGKHTWIVDGYQLTNDRFHFIVGFTNYDDNDWYPANNIYVEDEAIFNIIPDRTADALPVPYCETFENTATSPTDEFVQIPKYFGLGKTSSDYTVKSNIGYLNTKSFVRAKTNTEDSFIIKKINLNCNSVPILRYKYRINNYQNIVEGDSLIIEVSKDNRLTWNKVSKIDYLNFNSTSEYADKIISLNTFKNEIVNIRYHFYSDSNANSYEYYIDNIEVGQLGIDFTDLSNDDILPPLNEQPIKVTPSIVTPPKSKSNENCDMVMDFYIKEDTGGTVYNLMFTDSILENGIFEYPNWNTNNSLEKAFYIKAVARTKSNITTLDSTEIRVEISGHYSVLCGSISSLPK